MRRQPNEKVAPKNISVFLRVRPLIAREAKSSCNNLIIDPSDSRKITVSRKSGSRVADKSYAFNKVFPPKTTQEEVYKEFGRGAVDAAFDGQHGVLFVYGQTGSGKTYTISNEDPENLGVLQQCLREVWRRISNDKEHEYSCGVSYVQLYNEILTDLLDTQNGRVRIQLGPEGCGDVVLVAEHSGLSIEKKVQSYEETMELFRMGMNRKEMTSTMMNETSSRSHTVFNFSITRSTKVKVVEVKEDGTDSAPTIALEGRLVICDLAGSERVSKTQAEGKTLGEAVHINGSLLVLGKVVAALTEKKMQHAPFRESKLTRILQYSLLGNGNTSIVVNCSPSDDCTEETLSAIQFGQRAIQIKQEAKRHEVLDYKALYLQLMAELDSKNDGRLESVIAEERRVYEKRINALEDRVKMLSAENELLQRENAALQQRGGGASDAAATAAGWQVMSKQMREALDKRDAEIAVINNERYKLALLLAEEKSTAFRLAGKVRAILVRGQMESNRWMRQVEELSLELARLKGTDYIGIQASASNSLFAAGSTDDCAETDNSQLSVGGHGESFFQDQLEKANHRIQRLTQDRVELIVYQSKANKAIRLLHADKAALLEKLEKKENPE